MEERTGHSPVGTLVLMWAPSLIGVIAMIAFRNLYGVAVLFGCYAVTLAILDRARRGLTTGYAVGCLLVAVLLVVVQGLL